MRRYLHWILGAACAALLLSLPAAVPAKGKNPKGGGKVYIVPKAPPDSIFKKTDGNAVLSWFKANRKVEVWERDPEKVTEICTPRCVDEGTDEKKAKCMKSCEEKESGWHFWILIHLKKPLDDLELGVSFYDVEVFPRHHVNTFTMMLYKKGDKILTQNVKLHRPEFDANHRYQIEITSRKVIQAGQEFNLRGIPTVYSGEVDFSDEAK